MRINWDFSINDQPEIYTSEALKLKGGFYQNHRFYLLPFLPEKFRDRVLYLPETRYLNSLKRNHKSINLEAKTEITELASKTYKYHKSQLNKLNEKFEKEKVAFEKKINLHFPNFDKLEIYIKPALFGSLGGYNLYKNKMYVYPRFDRSLDNVFQLIITALTHYIYYGYKKELNNNSRLWKEKQLKSSELFTIFGISEKRTGVVRVLENSYSAKLALESNIYYKKLGYPVNSILNKNFLSKINLTKNEQTTLSLLAKNRNELTTFDDIADNLYKDDIDEKYSLYAITKLIERLRSKLNSAGINNGIIHTQRGVGYFLFD